MFLAFLLSIKEINLPSSSEEYQENLKPDTGVRLNCDSGRALLVFHNKNFDMTTYEIIDGKSIKTQSMSNDEIPNYLIVNQKERIEISAKEARVLYMSYIPLGQRCQKYFYISNQLNTSVEFTDEKTLRNDRCFIFAPLGNKTYTVSHKLNDHQDLFVAKPEMNLNRKDFHKINKGETYNASSSNPLIFTFNTEENFPGSSIKFTVNSKFPIKIKEFGELYDVKPEETPTPDPQPDSNPEKTSSSAETVVEKEDDRMSVYVFIMGVIIISCIVYVFSKCIKKTKSPHDDENLMDDNIVVDEDIINNSGDDDMPLSQPNGGEKTLK
ncbi:hypothetical protein TVAG_076090 [Trichomonas vaginalis G3]|uniref:Uncharacterized protein n=1 Tax=Trichomonas vaginalis (strain ATCC PRA-98 / G3) TaxID=412133 RepID=A2D9K6_TRIV3|nr:hypothetical protein TVAGG3_0293040 [Trichomonas vaginalis G3]EAY22862.1 hypothetical protein TVAG_076090 [Trichomonas vaginalis G3]KAI5527424.1 hypothetical protein TVAGG3_0293040 [Trichomonas vaginalis G3]|eukprot:XP_001583848.1 hypothetical protein [Trichomonas vaginalis G3]